jgi:hypothetical protein
VDLKQLNGTQRKILRQTIQSAFATEEQLNVFLEEELQKPPLANFAAGSNYDARAFDMIRTAQSVGWTTELIAKLQEYRAQNALVRNLADALRMAATDGPPRPPPAEMTLEKIVRGAGFVDLRPWAEKLVLIGQSTCRIEFPVGGDTGFGTGFLVADDLVMTNFHVVEGHLSGERNPADIRCRFDYARDAHGLQEGRLVALADGPTWIVAHSRYDDADISGTGTPAADHLDFALLRLGEAAGQHELGGGARRGTVAVPRQPPMPKATAPVFIIQHPKGKPMVMAIGIVQHDLAESDVRIRYDTDTENGSSGSGVFDQRLGLIALHHAGDPATKIQAQYNQGIPIARIVAHLAAGQVAPFWR